MVGFPDIYGPSAPLSTSRAEKVPLCPAAESAGEFVVCLLCGRRRPNARHQSQSQRGSENAGPWPVHHREQAPPLGDAPREPIAIGVEGDDPTPGIAAEANGVAGPLVRPRHREQAPPLGDAPREPIAVGVEGGMQT